MRRVSVIAIASICALSLGACSLVGGEETVSESAPETEAAPESATAEVPAEAGKEPFADPTVPGKEGQDNEDNKNDKNAAQKAGSKGRLPANLIGATNPDQRLRSIARERTDPFTLVSVIPEVKESEEAIARREAELKRQRDEALAKEKQRAAFRRVRTAGFTPAQQIVSIPTIPNVPLEPQRPNLAARVAVTGVVQVAGRTYAIVDAPDEPGGRYVEVGQRIANGRVLVKQISANRAKPAVLLEYLGMEVLREVGDPPESTTDGRMQAANPFGRPAL